MSGVDLLEQEIDELKKERDELGKFKKDICYHGFHERKDEVMRLIREANEE